MDNMRETILYLAYNLFRQNQTFTEEGIGKLLGWTQGNDYGLEEEINWLITNGFIIRCRGKLRLTEAGDKAAFEISKKRTKDEFNQLIQCAVGSEAYLDFCEDLYGYRMYLFNMMDRLQLDNLFHKVLVKENDTVLDLGCGTGSILNRLVSEYGCHAIGIDRIDDELVKQCSPLINYVNDDLDNLRNYCLQPDLTLSVDSLYFSNNLDALVQSLINAGNCRLYVYYSQYIFDENTKDKAVLHYDYTRIASSLQKNELAYKVIDYSLNEKSLYENGLTLLPHYKKALIREGNYELYKTKLREYKCGKELYDKELASRYLYIIT